MAESFTSYSVDNDKRFRNALSAASETVQDFRVPFGLILKDFYKSEQAIFKLKGPGLYPPFKNSEGDYGRVKYKTKTGKNRTKKGFVTSTMSEYQKQKLKKYGFDYPLLVRTGALAASVLGPNNPGSVSNITKLSLIFGSSIPYGVYHQSDDTRTKIPLRKFLFIGPEAPQFANSDQQGRLQRWLGYIQDSVTKAAQKALNGG